ncbi:MAG: glycosyl hydrolase, partial [Terriglobia bacterium]
LYAGTERGVWMSFDDGENWQPLQLNLPVVPIHDLMVQAREKDLVVATHGRSFWVLDDLTPLYQLSDAVAKAPMHLFQPRLTYRMRGGGFGGGGGGRASIGRNPASGAVVFYYFKDKPKEDVKLDFLDSKGKLMRSFSSRVERREGDQSQQQQDPGEEGFFGGGGGPPRLPADSGMNRFTWNLRSSDATAVPGAIFWAGNVQGPIVVPGMYVARLVVGKDTVKQSFEVKFDPRVETPQAELQEQFDLLMKVREKLSATHEAINNIRDIKKQTEDVAKRAENHPSKATIADASKKLNQKLSAVEEELIQVKIKSNQDALNYPIKLNNKLAALAGTVGSADTRPTKQEYDVFADLSLKVDFQLAKLKDIVASELPAFNKLVKEQDIPAVILKTEKKGM